jgi:hypothetical protein
MPLYERPGERGNLVVLVDVTYPPALRDETRIGIKKLLRADAGAGNSETDSEASDNDEDDAAGQPPGSEPVQCASQ